ncbi:MAG: hypothetical protein E2590_11315 [Chryseobacterium sp.]|uniref:hypothetical protein n=1 Tax=Epilithonimonas caeni TaxID=365343 RepID=UPI00041DF0B3|nr:hypothetical protein [Epilithonimonas caeni]MPS73721.1 hypothetical protein [Chryseobacterium sp.]
MKKTIFVLSLISSVFFYSQNYSSLDKILEKLETRSKKMKDASGFDIKDKKFVLIEDFDDHSERHILEFRNDNSLTLIEVIDDKSTDKTYSNIFSGDYIRKKNAISVRADHLEGKKISIPITHNLYLMNANNIWYLKDINTNKRWIENSNLLKKKN